MEDSQVFCPIGAIFPRGDKSPSKTNREGENSLKEEKQNGHSVLEQNVNRDKKARNSVVCAGTALTFWHGLEQ